MCIVWRSEVVCCVPDVCFKSQQNWYKKLVEMKTKNYYMSFQKYENRFNDLKNKKHLKFVAI